MPLCEDEAYTQAQISTNNGALLAQMWHSTSASLIPEVTWAVSQKEVSPTNRKKHDAVLRAGAETRN